MRAANPQDSSTIEAAVSAPKPAPQPDCVPEVAGHIPWLADGRAILDNQGNVVAVDEAMLHWLAASQVGVQGKPFWPRIWQLYPHWHEVVKPLLVDGVSFGRVDLANRVEEPDHWFSLELAQASDQRFVRLSSSLPPVAARGETGWDETMGNAAAQRHMYLRMMRAEAQLSNLVQRWPGVIFSQRPDLSFQFVNERIEEWTGIPVAEWQRNTHRFREVIHECDDGELTQQLKNSSATPGGSMAIFRLRHVTTGRVTYVREHRKGLVSQSGLLLGYEGDWVDVSRQTIAEKRLSSASWMETLAVLTAGLAHDFSNVIAGVQALGEAFQAQLPEDHPFQEGLGLIKNSTQNATQIVRRILNLHQGKPGERAYHDLNELVRELIELVRITVPRRIEIKVELGAASLPVYADPVELRQVFVNLVLNAVEAMPDRGKLTIRTTRLDQPPTIVHGHGSLPVGPCVGVRIEDQGMGIPARHLKTIFDPFFTTKPGNKGSGLGLYNARLFAEKHRGALSVESKEKVGTTFCLWLPQADFTEADRERQIPRLHRRTLLLIGPSEKYRNDIVVALRQQGHYVVTVPVGEDPLELLASPNYEFSGILVLATRPDELPELLFRHIRGHKLPVKTILQVVGGNRDEFGARSLEQIDLVVGAETSSPELLASINALLEGTAIRQP